MKFKREKKSMLTGETAVIFTMVSPDGKEWPEFWITGHSPELFTPQDFEDLAKAIGAAAKEFLQLKPKLSL